jgi:predicted Ser/Thr protein kinase
MVDEAKSSVAFSLPETIEHYKIISMLGHGGMGEVFLAEDPLAGNRKVAIKTVSLGEYLPAAKKESLRLRLREEAHALGRVAHPAVPTLYHVIEKESAFFIVMEYVEGRSLTDVIGQNEMLSQERIVRIGVDVLEALAAAHAEKVIHRDIKPSNIMLMPDGSVKLIDFGLAKNAELAKDLTQSNATPGTPGYMAPEQIAGEDATPQSDLFCLGIVLYELLTGQTPFKGKTNTEVAFSILYEAPPDIRDLNPALPEGLSEAIMRALAKDPHERFESASAMAEALQKGPRSSCDSRVEPVSPVDVRRPAPRKKPRKPAPGAAPSKRAWKRTIIVGACALALLVSAGAFAIDRFTGQELAAEVEIAKAQSDAKSAQARAVDLQTALDGALADKTKAEHDREAAVQTLNETRVDLTKALDEKAMAQAQTAEARTREQVAVAGRETAENETRRAREDLADARKDKELAVADSRSLQERLLDAEKDRNDLRADLQAANAKARDAEAKLAAAGDRALEAEKKLSATEADAKALRARIAALEGQAPPAAKPASEPIAIGDGRMIVNVSSELTQDPLLMDIQRFQGQLAGLIEKRLAQPGAFLDKGAVITLRILAFTCVAEPVSPAYPGVPQQHRYACSVTYRLQQGDQTLGTANAGAQSPKTSGSAATAKQTSIEACAAKALGQIVETMKWTTP